MTDQDEDLEAIRARAYVVKLGGKADEGEFVVDLEAIRARAYLGQPGGFAGPPLLTDLRALLVLVEVLGALAEIVRDERAACARVKPVRLWAYLAAHDWVVVPGAGWTEYRSEGLRGTVPNAQEDAGYAGDVGALVAKLSAQQGCSTTLVLVDLLGLQRRWYGC